MQFRITRPGTVTATKSLSARRMSLLSMSQDLSACQPRAFSSGNIFSFRHSEFPSKMARDDALLVLACLFTVPQGTRPLTGRHATQALPNAKPRRATALQDMHTLFHPCDMDTSKSANSLHARHALLMCLANIAISQDAEPQANGVLDKPTQFTC